MLSNKNLAKLIIDVVNQTENDYDARDDVEDILNHHRKISTIKRAKQIFAKLTR
jgi:hypothetical protein